MDELVRMTATDVVSLLRRREVSPRELVEVSVARIEAVDSEVNALPTRCFERAREQAVALEKQPAHENPRSLLGLPIAVKDYNDVGGVSTTYGSPIYADNVPTQSDTTVARLEANGAIPVAKANVPEWAGGHTFNPVHGTTRNPWNTHLSAGGSSGGSAAALASGSVWLATGNDFGGSLRTPASFNGVVGMRPGPGLVPRPPRNPAYDVLWVEGPMGRSVSDVALMLDAGAGYAANDPLSFDSIGSSFQDCIWSGTSPERVAFSPDLGVVPMTPSVAAVCERAASRMSELGTDVTDDIPDFTGAVEGFQTLRAVLVATMMGPMLKAHRERIAPEIVGNIERGFAVTMDELFEAERVRSELNARMTAFFRTHDLLLCPAASITPFPVEQRFVEEINGQPCKTYIDWFSITFAITMTSCPVISLPCGFSDGGMPIGMQIIGKPRHERELLRAAHRLEEILGISNSVPIDPRSPA